MYHKEVEYRSYGLYSDVAKQSGYTTGQIDTVYSWYLNKTFADLVEKPTCQIFLKGLGMLQIHLSSAVNNLSRSAYGLEQSLQQYDSGMSKDYMSFSYLNERVTAFMSASSSLKERANIMLEKEIINETLYQNKMTRIESIDLKLNQLYESIQRIPELEQKRTAECGQSPTWGNQQDSSPIPLIES